MSEIPAYFDGVGEAIPAPSGQQATRRRWTVADLLTVVRLPLAVAFFLVDVPLWRALILAVAAATDLLDGAIARRLGGSRLGAVLDPVADKLFMVSAAGAVLLSGRVPPLLLLAVLLRDIVATLAFAWVLVIGRPAAIAARWSGKAATIGQMAMLFAFVVESSLIVPFAWVAAAAGLWAIADYRVVANRDRQRLS